MWQQFSGKQNLSDSSSIRYLIVHLCAFFPRLSGFTVIISGWFHVFIIFSPFGPLGPHPPPSRTRRRTLSSTRTALPHTSERPSLPLSPFLSPLLLRYLFVGLEWVGRAGGDGALRSLDCCTRRT